MSPQSSQLRPLRAAGKILLVNTYSLGQQPTQLASVAATLRAQGFQPSVVDTAVDKLGTDAIEQAELVVIFVPMHTALRLGVGIAGRLKTEAESIHRCFAGHYALLNSDYLLSQGLADSIIGGECESNIAALAVALENGEPLPEHVGTGTQAPVATLRRQPLQVPQRTGLPELKRYAGLVHRGETAVVGSTDSTRGCKHCCSHCPIPPVYGGRFFAVPVELVLADIDQLVSAGARHITFADPDFLNGPGHARRVIEALHRNHPDLTWDFTAKIEHLLKHDDLLGMFARSGCLFVVSAVESFDDKVLENLQKGHTAAEVERAGALLDRHGIVLRPTFVPFTPWSGTQGYVTMLRKLRQLGWYDRIDPVQYTIRLLVPPGSLLESAECMQPSLGALDAANFERRWVHDDPAVDALHRQVAKFMSGLMTVVDVADIDAEAVLQHLEVMALKAAVDGDQQPCAPQSQPDASLFESLRLTKRPETAPPRMTEPWFC